MNRREWLVTFVYMILLIVFVFFMPFFDLGLTIIILIINITCLYYVIFGNSGSDMKYCKNCKQDVTAKRNPSLMRKILGVVLILILIILAYSYFYGGLYSGYNDGSGGFMFFIFLALLVIPILYITSSKVCPICKSNNFKN